MLKIFGHYIPRALLLLYLSEITVLFNSILIAILVTATFINQDILVLYRYSGIHIAVVSYILIMQLAMIATGLYQRDLPSEPSTIILRIILSFILGIILFVPLANWMQLDTLNQDVLILAFSCAFIGILASRLLLCKRADNTPGHCRALVLGSGDNAVHLESVWSERKLPRATSLFGTDTVINGYVDTNGGFLPKVEDNRLVKLNGKSLCEYAKENKIIEIIIAMDDRRKQLPIDDLIECRMNGINIVDANNFLERESGKIILDSFQPSSFIYSEGFMQVVRMKTKRLLDIVSSLFILTVSSPVILVTAIAIWLESGGKGPIIYRQERIGIYGRPFLLLKFRSMVVNAEKDGNAVWASKNDNRVTRVGQFIRRTRIDELPQLFNVFKGEMSLIGPRPERPQIVEGLIKQIPFYYLRHHAQPGITGWAQICYPYGASLQDAKEKLQYDLYYIKNYSIFLDILILIQTIAVVLFGKGAR